MYKYHLITYGCQMNKSDSERIDSVLQSANFKPAQKNRADVLIINLCSVRQSAVDRVWGQINNLKAQNSNVKCIILTGCILSSDKNKFKSKVDLILNIAELPNWPKIIINKIKEKNQFLITNYQSLITKPKPCPYPNYFSISPKYQSSFTAYVPIMTGCNNFCAYCVVPYVRGREQSRPAEDILGEVYNLIIRGYKEIILLGQNVNSYQGRILNYKLSILNQFQSFNFKSSKNKKIDFPGLLKMIDKIPGDYWLNFVSSHPKDLSADLIDCYKTLEHLTPYLHLPVQSGSDRIIKAMNRHYTANEYLKLINKIRKAKPGIAITTDIIVGFPDETEKDFKATFELMKKIKFDMAYIAQYSPRIGTAAFKLLDNVSKSDKKKREKILTEILEKTALKKNQQLIGQSLKILITQSKDKYLLGRTNQFKNVKINLTHSSQLAACSSIGQFIKVKIIKANPWGLQVKVINC